MTRLELAKRLNGRMPHYKVFDIVNMLKTTFNEIEKGMAEGNKVQLRELGTFYTKIYSARIGVDPRDGAKIELKDKVLPVFKTSGKLVCMQKDKK